MFKNAHFDFVGKRKIFFIISIALVLFILLFSVIFGVKVDVQFKGGTIITYSYEGNISESELKTLAKDTIGSDVSISFKGGLSGKDSFDITLESGKGLESEKQTLLTQELTKKYGDSIEFLTNSSVDPTIGTEFFYKSLVAVAFAALVLIIYIAFRFKKIGGWSAGVMAVIALLNDVIVVFGTFVIFRIPLDYNFIAVVLTILGYSINGTIIIYDRLRENKKLTPSMPLDELVNSSINGTLSRTVNTTVATLISMVVITVVAFIMGVNSILSFSFPMIIGMVSGVYTTLFIAGPLWVQWQKHKAKKNNVVVHRKSSK